MYKIAILVPVCSRGHTYTSIDETPFFKHLYPSFLATREDGYEYTFFIGFDDDDQFYMDHKDGFQHVTPNVYALEGCQHAPARAWNKLAEHAYTSDAQYDYLFQVGDDVTLLKPGWTSRFIGKLRLYSNVGVVGPCFLANYYGRVRNGNPPVIENSFVHRTHMDIFGYYFYPEILNWFCDDWITRVYRPFFSEIQVDMECQNTILGSRYAIKQCKEIDTYVNDGTERILRYLGRTSTNG